MDITPKKRANSGVSGPGLEVSPTQATRLERIAKAAWLKAQARGFVPGHELDDWLEAERELDGKPAHSASK